jgi:hypothetical protein
VNNAFVLVTGVFFWGRHQYQQMARTAQGAPSVSSSARTKPSAQPQHQSANDGWVKME